MSNHTASIQITPEDKRLKITSTFSIFSRKDDGFVSCYIPGFGMYFSAQDEGIVRKRGNAMINAYYQHWFNDMKDPKHFFLDLHKKGFRTNNHDFILKQLLNKKMVKTKFHTDQRQAVPEHFKLAEKQELETSLTV